ncbi:conjugal transfer protein MobB [Empedobacter falsenii]|uniref:Relaxase/mobilization nuclease domain-containing protein n=1 Tax=Empedobacter falsenii TaxID=343874 RepID=A0AAW7DG13_9FLAO|nr:conjugal transfer protein MobB [Empedobacter falsenii]MDM1550505.1 relaxase/mobilization nuclease domain-containing protein [Empedobacter falsenii]
MIAKIGRSHNLYGALAYNHLKVEKEKGQILMINKMIETPNEQYSVNQFALSFAPYLIANRNTEKHTLHISLNPNPKNELNDEQFQDIAVYYMQEMGYGNQPYVVFKHTDTGRSHIHIVSVCVDENGKKISDKFEKRRSMNVCRELEQKFGLIPAISSENKQNHSIFQPVNYQNGEIKSQIASIVRHLPNLYFFQTFGEYNALLSLFNITAEKVEGERNGKLLKGLIYFALNEKGEKVSLPFKSSLFGKNTGLLALEKHFEKNKEQLKNHPTKVSLKYAISNALQTSTNELTFKNRLAEQNINVVIRKNSEDRIYGVTFIDHHSKTVWNGSRLGKEFSANAFHESWKNDSIQNNNSTTENKSSIKLNENLNFPIEKEQHHLFDFLNEHKEQGNLLEIFGCLIPHAQHEEFDNFELNNDLMKKRKRKRKQ